MALFLQNMFFQPAL